MEQRRPRICMVGSSNTDLVTRVARYPGLGQSVTASSFHVAFGGKGANQAVMAARLGALVSVVTRLGRDVFGSDYLRHYEAEGIDTRFVTFDEEQSSGIAVILVDEPTALNTITFVPGSNGTLAPEHVQAAREALATANVVLAQLEVPTAATLEAFRIGAAAPSRPILVLNAAPVPGDPVPDELLSLAGVLVVNEEEAAYLGGEPVESLDQATAAVASLAARWAASVVVTLGSRGVVYAAPGTAVRHVPAPQVQAVDTTGAGDAFVGTLGFGLASGAPLALAVERAVTVATRTVLAAGAQPSYPAREEVGELFPD